MRRNSHSIAPIFVENSDSFSKLKIIGLDQDLLKNFVEAFDFMTKVATLAEFNNHHPEWCNVYNKVIVDLSTHESNGITIRDFSLAKEMERIA